MNKITFKVKDSFKGSYERVT